MNTVISNNERGRNFSKTPPKRIDRNKPNNIITRDLPKGVKLS